MSRVPSWPLDNDEHLAQSLSEQGATPEEIEDLMPALLRLSEWQAPQPSPADTQRLFVQLTSALPAPSPVRQAIREERQRGNFSWLLSLARAQVSLFSLSFWLVSAFVTLLGAIVVLTIPSLEDPSFYLRAVGPLLAYLGTVSAFRGTQLRVLEFELVCLPTPWQLALARLVIVLGYDVGLGLALCLAFWAGGAGQALALLISWFMPLLLVAGLALLLSLRLSIQAAAALAYGSWLALLALSVTLQFQTFLLTTLSETLLGGLGLALVAFALLRLHSDMHRLLPRV
ncbi:MAG TPA: hypothetical protein VFU32_02015 [Ktedonobacterales bacterium]|nr:hypothetical protein [Ktedonobacterales bacterium]